MKTYIAIVNGNKYEVQIMESNESAAAPAAAAPAPAAAPKAAPKAAAGASDIAAPMPGKVLSINCKAGDAVKAGDCLLILEAMKMENEILAPADGTVSAVNVIVGQTVDSGDALISF